MDARCARCRPWLGLPCGRAVWLPRPPEVPVPEPSEKCIPAGGCIRGLAGSGATCQLRPSAPRPGPAPTRESDPDRLLTAPLYHVSTVAPSRGIGLESCRERRLPPGVMPRTRRGEPSTSGSPRERCRARPVPFRGAALSPVHPAERSQRPNRPHRSGAEPRRGSCPRRGG